MASALYKHESLEAVVLLKQRLSHPWLSGSQKD
jgi:hypothetical protein